MNTARIKAYAIQARRDFIKAVTERANACGIFSDDEILPMTLKGDTAIIAERAFPKKEGELRQMLAERVQREGFEAVIRAAAYTWFNRFAALRYMELHDYLDHGCRVLSSRDGDGPPEILERAAEIDLPGVDREQVIALKLAGTKDNELYRLLILAQCSALHEAMPFLFDRIDSDTELLLPDNLLLSDSPVRRMVTEIDESDWNDVEIIGWIYQFYISERKNEVIGKVVKSEDIPAATQLFTPKWIVQYMLHNTLGRMWLATYPDSPLKDKLEYYIEPGEQEPEVQKQLDAAIPRELDPEAITLLDPACGSGHILVEAYDIFKEIYRERGYRTRDIPRLILEKNLYGLDIDQRAAQLACFAVLMKARADDRRIFQYKDLRLNVHSIVESQSADLRTIELFFDGKDHEELRADLQELVELFRDAKTFGSLIKLPLHLTFKMPVIQEAVQKRIGTWVSKSKVQNILALVRQAATLARKYDCVVTNPPYMGGKGMNGQLKDFAKRNFPDSKSDLFAMFIERNLDFAAKERLVGMITMQSWMFLSSFEKLRDKLLDNYTILSMAHLGARAFDSIGGEVVSTSTFILANDHQPEYKGSYVRLVDGNAEAEKIAGLKEAIQNPDCGWFFRASAADFKKIPGSPIAYWVSDKVRFLFQKLKPLSQIAKPRQGLATSNNNYFLKFWFEPSISSVGFKYKSRQEALKSRKKWFPCQKGGPFRKWYGNIWYVINWENDGEELLNFAAKLYKSPTRTIKNIPFYFREGITWSTISSSAFSMRYSPWGFISETKGAVCFSDDRSMLIWLLSFSNSKLVNFFLKVISPTLDFHEGPVGKLPLMTEINIEALSIAEKCVYFCSLDWNSYETSWEFATLPLLQSEHHQPTLEATYDTLRTHWRDMTLKMQRLEEENNRIFIETYGLQDELTPEVPLAEITLTCNPHYRYNGLKSEEELETLLRTDTTKELISYAVGCMMGRYSLDEPGLVYAHSGNEGFDASKYRTFPADDDGIIPVMDRAWFADDAAARFVEFLKTAWPAENLEENLRFVANQLKPRRSEGPLDTIRRYFSTAFFKDHLKTYKKRPIYWLFSSGKQKAFECLVYLHRYNESTLSRMRSTYVTPLQGNFSARLEFLENEKDAAATASAQKKLQKEIDVLKKKQAELARFDDELRHHADMKITLDLDDGVKVNYGKFGSLLAEKKAVTGKK